MKNIEVPIAKRMLEIYASAVDGKINVTTEIIEAANTLYALQAEIERLKGEYARGIEDAAKWHDKEIVEITSQLDQGIANSDGEIQMVMERIFHKRVATEIRALIPKQK